jgi:hypothetical protein
MATTKNDMRDLVLQHLGVFEVGEAATADDAAIVESTIDGVFEEMVAQELAYWETTDFPDEIKMPFRDAVAARLGGTFHLPLAQMQFLKSEGAQGWRDVRRHAANRPKSDSVKAVYY